MKKNFTKQDFYYLLTPNGECLEWSLGKNTDGYGRTYVDGKVIKTHRLALELEGISIPKDNIVLHSCDNPSCCNPLHLSIGTYSENMKDMAKKGRHTSNLSDDEVIQILELIDSGCKQIDIAKKFGVTPSCISSIKHKKRWSHL